jgi:16S rRNA (cytosine967-C5)-methyltransferase
MGRFHSYLNSSKEILSTYQGKEPFSFYLKKYFAANKKMGSKDRREISDLCYSFFRLGITVMDLSVEERILAGKFLCSSGQNDLLGELKPEWNNRAHLSVNEKLEMFGAGWEDVFPWPKELSEGIEFEKFAESFFFQPDLFLRIRPGYAEKVLLTLNKSGVICEFISPYTIRLPNSFKADKYFELDKEVVVQDYNSQKVMDFIPVRPGRSERVWDCCAGSGGKSIMAYDLDPGIELTVSDVRESILVNLKKRFERAGIKKYRSLILDLKNVKPQPSIFNNLRLNDPAGQDYSILIADGPCTGSGTWSRTPEQLSYFDEKQIEEYAALQKNIVSNVIPQLQPGCQLLYITCSVFKKENEDAVYHIKEKFHLQLLKMELLKGYPLKADTMFAALLQKPL